MEKGNVYGICWGYLLENGHFGGCKGCGRIMLRWILGKGDVRTEVNITVSLCQVAGIDVRYVKTSGSVRELV
jgi:hypothetical protein